MTLTRLRKALGIAALAGAALGTAAPASAERPDDGLVFTYQEALAGKKVAFVPITMGFDLTQGWMAAVQRDADRLGYELTIRDPNWNVDAGAQAIEQLINEKPDLLIVHNNDMQAYTKLIRRAMSAGINVIQMNLKTPVNSDAFVGGDWYDVGVKTAQEAARFCGEGTSGKIAVVQGPVTAPPNQLGVAGVEDALAEYPEIQIVSNQAADWDASKARSIASTIIKQHGDLCAFIGLWDNMDVGIAAAIREAGLTDQIKLVSTGGGNQEFGCTNLENGSFASYVKVDTRDQAHQLAETIQILLQTRPEPGSQPFGLYTENKILTPDNIGPGSCWTLDGIRAGD
ncbi:sugar ABC transporter substrate-binding protein [Celeribacter indicus]|uniref:ABC transporter substrate-binding protein n=1 Tax=Celeribacter indicus TaxID=1208324 RepID=A0A0B5DYE0_9RHOB|nr:sugar ABC transporter substrate-binding protein [Celeribacter indicus]AJE45212.1 ABC transporter substrate-binding protein [Celeribacter indicus]SDX45424.1 monosaccharide ABC transporter substrate-binding protein, CUT2 family [Celeribacter indicus]